MGRDSEESDDLSGKVLLDCAPRVGRNPSAEHGVHGANGLLGSDGVARGSVDAREEARPRICAADVVERLVEYAPEQRWEGVREGLGAGGV